jgi:hypothetical protein
MKHNIGFMVVYAVGCITVLKTEYSEIWIEL